MIKVRMLELRTCACGQAWGYYLEDDLTAEIGGTAIPVAIQNDELRDSIQNRPKSGRGAPLNARVLPEEYDTLQVRDEPRISS